MIKFTIDELLISLEIKNDLNLNLKQLITNIQLNSKQVVNGEVFVAIVGDNKNGHDYLEEARAKGAVFAIVEYINHNVSLPQILVPDTKLALGKIAKYLAHKWQKQKVCITGSNGKTTTKFILSAILEQSGDVLCPQASFNNHIGVPLAMFSATDSQWAGIFEMGTNHPGEISYLSSLIQADVAILTTVSITHIGNFINLNAIANEKFNIFNNLKPGGTAIYNYDLSYKDVLLKKLEGLNNIKQLSFGFDHQADVWADQITLHHDKSSFRLNYLNKTNGNNYTEYVDLYLLGKHQILNALAAAAAAFSLGLDIVTIKHGLAKVRPVNKRMQAIKLDDNTVIIDDSYNASPASVAVALSYLAQCHGQKIFVLGDLGELGDLAEQEHEKIGILAKELKIDLLFALGDFSKYTLQAFYDGNTETKGRRYQQQFADKQELCNTLLRCIQEECQEEAAISSCTILVKGSNFMKMWEVTDKLRKVTNN